MSDRPGKGDWPERPLERFRAFPEEKVDCTGLRPLIDHCCCALARQPGEDLIRLLCADMLRDLPGAVAQATANVGLARSPEAVAAPAEAARFANMKADAGFFGSASSRNGKAGRPPMTPGSTRCRRPPNATGWKEAARALTRCPLPRVDAAILSREWTEALRDRLGT